MPGLVLAASAAFREVLAGLDPVLYEGAECARVVEDLSATEKACAAVRVLFAARAAQTGAVKDLGFADAEEWLARRSGTTRADARRALQTAGALEDLPDTKAALLAGDVSLAQAGEIVQADADNPGAEADLLPVARNADLSRLRDAARDRRLALTEVDDLRRQQRRARYFRHWRDRLGMVRFTGALPPESGVPLIHRLELATARARRAAKQTGQAESWKAHAADALAAMLTDTKVGRGDRAELVVVCDINALRRGHAHEGEPCHLLDGGPIPVAVARELAKDAFLKTVIHDGVNIHTVCHNGRYRPAELETAITLGSPPTFSGKACVECGKRWGLEVDHVNPVNNRGPTAYSNLQHLCWDHHNQKTERDRQAGLLGPHPPLTGRAVTGPGGRLSWGVTPVDPVERAT